jgi:hypothetical protein
MHDKGDDDERYIVDGNKGDGDERRRTDVRA